MERSFMRSWRSQTLAVTVALQAIALAQTPRATGPSRIGVLQSLQPEPPVPSDPLEMVSGEAQPVQSAEQRQVVTALLQNARALSKVRAQAYDLKTTFTSFGSSTSDGNWSLEDTSPSGRIYRWTAQGPGYASVNLTNNQMFYSSQPAIAMPLRLAQVRDAIFYVYPAMGPYMSLRTANGYLNGAALHCVLAGTAFGGRTFSGGRNWEESEYCIDPNSNLLMTYSPVPGLYIRYDYTNAFRFHGKIIAGAFTISEAGRSVIEARTESVTDPTGANPALFEPSGLTARGVGAVMTPPARVRGTIGPMPQNGNATVNVVVLHGVMSPDGHLSEPEILASTNPSLNQAALDRAGKWQPIAESQQGTTPQSHEVFFTYDFVTPLA